MNKHNNDCSISDRCINCTLRTTQEERAECRQQHLRWLTEKEMDTAVKEMLVGVKKNKAISERTKYLMSLDAIRAAQDEKTWRIVKGG